jgi:hypothetical protein
LQRGRRGLALALAVVTALSSPVAALFLALAGAAYALGGKAEPNRSIALVRHVVRRPVGVALAVAALTPVLALAVAFPEGGTEPFTVGALWPVIAFTLVALPLLPREAHTLRAGVALYALGSITAFAISTPVGGNVVRLGALCAGPVAALVLWRRRPLALALLALPLLWWQWTAPIDDVRTALGDPTVHASYYTPLLSFLDRQGGSPGRLEIPFTRIHWESARVAPRYALARGWERQLDIADDALFYKGTLTPVRYRAWLDQLAVRWVALPDSALDYSATQEAALIRGGLPYLHEAWAGGHWRVFAVRDPTPLVGAPARIAALGPDSFTVDVPRPANLRVRMRWTPYWAVASGDACVAPDGDWTELRVRAPGSVRIATRFAFDRIGSRSARCHR